MEEETESEMQRWTWGAVTKNGSNIRRRNGEEQQQRTLVHGANSWPYRKRWKENCMLSQTTIRIKITRAINIFMVIIIIMGFFTLKGRRPRSNKKKHYIKILFFFVLSYLTRTKSPHTELWHCWFMYQPTRSQKTLVDEYNSVIYSDNYLISPQPRANHKTILAVLGFKWAPSWPGRNLGYGVKGQVWVRIWPVTTAISTRTPRHLVSI